MTAPMSTARPSAGFPFCRDRIGREEAGIDLGNIARAEQAHRAQELRSQDVESETDAFFSADGKAVKRSSSRKHPLRSQRQRLGDVTAAPDAAVDHHIRLAAGRRDDA